MPEHEPHHDRPHNPYSPPGTAVSAGAGDARPGSPIKAVLLGLLVDIGGTLVATTVIALFYGIFLAASHGTDESQLEAALADPAVGSLLRNLSMVAGSVCSVLGGYVCARIARRPDHKLAWVLAGCSIVTGLVLGAGESTSNEVLGLQVIATLVCVLLGSWIGTRRQAPRA